MLKIRKNRRLIESLKKQLTVADVKDILQNAIDELDSYDETSLVKLAANTYGVDAPYLAMYEGFLDLNNIEVQDADADEEFDFDEEFDDEEE